MPHPDSEGLLILDKPAGMTSHDVVSRVRRLLRVRRVGHAGTLDPLATGVLVVMVGSATKLAPFLSAERKSYAARVRFGMATATLDAEGEITARAELPSWFADPAERDRRVEAALNEERQRRLQVPPAFSAIKIGGRAAHARARAGEALELEPRPVQVSHLALLAEPGLLPKQDDPSETACIDLSMTVSKGYYVRALARDLGERLEIPTHLGQLRRTASGCFDLSQAAPLPNDSEPLLQHLMALGEAARRALPHATLTATGVRQAACGQRLGEGAFLEAPTAAGPMAWLDHRGHLVAVGQLQPDGSGQVLRGFAT